jgi:hypothetical protein
MVYTTKEKNPKKPYTISEAEKEGYASLGEISGTEYFYNPEKGKFLKRFNSNILVHTENPIQLGGLEQSVIYL